MSVPKPSKARLKALWESGVQLDFAWVIFAPTFGYFSWLALKTHPNNEENISSDPRYEALKDWLPKTWEARQRTFGISKRNLRIWLLQEIHAGNLWAIGCRTLESGDDEPVRIPRQRFSVNRRGALTPPTKINWGKGDLTTAEKSYFDIRVARPVTDTETMQTYEGAFTDLGALLIPSDEHGSILPGGIDRIMSEFKSAGESYIDLSGVRPRIEDQTVETDDGTRATRAGRPPIDPRIQPKIEELWRLPHFRTIKSRIKQAREVRAQILGEEYRHLDETPNLTTRMIARLIGKFSKGQLRQSSKG